MSSAFVMELDFQAEVVQMCGWCAYYTNGSRRAQPGLPL